MKATKIPTIGIDIDGTVTSPSSIVPLMNECFGKDLRYEDCRDYNLANIYKITDEEFSQWLDQYGERLYGEAPVHGTADQVLRNWFLEYNLVYISARETRHLDVTRNWFSRYDIPYHAIDLVGTHNKLEAAQRWGVDLFLEDRLENALQLTQELQIPVFLFDTPYNQGSLPQLVHRVTSWEEVQTKVKLFFPDQTLV